MKNKKINTADLAKVVAQKYGASIIQYYELDMTIKELENAIRQIGRLLFKNILRALIIKKQECVLRYNRKIQIIFGYNRSALKSNFAVTHDKNN